MKHGNRDLTVSPHSLILTRYSLEGSLGEGGHEVDMGVAPAQLVLQGPEGLGEGPLAAAGGNVAQLKVEGGEDGVDDGPLDVEGHGDDAHQDHQELEEQRGEQLGEDDGSEHHNEQGDEVTNLAEIKPEVVLGGAVALVVVVVALGRGVAVLGGPVAGVGVGEGGRAPGGCAIAGLLTTDHLVMEAGHHQEQDHGGGQHLQSVRGTSDSGSVRSFRG